MTYYQKRKAEIRQKAIDWQTHFENDTSISYLALAHQQRKLEKLGKRYGLLKEFRNEGIL